MSVPTYDKFIEPVLRVLQKYPNGLPAKEVHEYAADFLGLNDEQRAKFIASGQLIYKNRAGWAHDRLKRAGLSQSLSRGKWCLTDKGFQWAVQHPSPLDKKLIDHITFDFVDISLKNNTDITPLNTNIPPSTKITAYETSSPDDRLDDAYQEIRHAVAEELLNNLLQVSPNRFEIIVLDILHQLGYGANREDLQRVGNSGDGGIDGIISLDKLGLEKIYVQAKRWQSTVGRPDLQTFYGALAEQKAKRGIFITTSSFTTHAVNFAKSVAGMVLVDGNRLVNLMIDNEIGVSSRIIKLPKIDTDYFE
ncbi:restriction endonuclease [Arsenophonus nasoniae]|uniref:Methylated adenine and cytosine restriction protein n=1 Tax=Arsenophonus nasoniae TaxID=638 RepID=D2TZT4_9GAMM|nr:restriction endonuclease [Arsenophonus nasoniae]QBY41755.1 Mrr restriction system protein [Arsenophonus nasoniae]WGM01820.1 restriction endonuclease [Arsenophonus nasoniae]WGM05938.1 restriction endonuclease [Arsenophonus nasoniae]WGM10948.1 restriction endonuclease [Arsenophonus nasoniae]WGM15651.1 restriction endonuclease [Arsenophonus nasoniae]